MSRSGRVLREDGKFVNEGDFMSSMLGQKGGILLTDTTAITGEFVVIKAVTDCTFTTLATGLTKNGTTTAATGADFGILEAGMTIEGNITAVTLASGKAILYR